MQTTLTSPQIEKVQQALLGADSDALIDLIFRLNFGQPPADATSPAIAVAQSLGWVTADAPNQLTDLGHLVADPLREYRLWLDRNRRIHGEKDHPLLAPERYAEKAVLEVGSGFGCNLLSLGLRAQGVFMGVEPMALYRQFTPILARREGLPTPRIQEGTGENLPFHDESFDVVLCYSSHQYMDIHKALREMVRVLRPGGQLQIIGATLDSYSATLMKQLLRRPSPSGLLYGARTLVNTLSYQWRGRRIWLPASKVATAAPIYPARRAMCEWLGQTGLLVRHDLIQPVDSETCFVADKPARAHNLPIRLSPERHAPERCARP